MELPSQLQHPHTTQQDGGRFCDAQVLQEGSHFGATHAANGAAVFQGNFVGLTFTSSTAARADFAGHFAHAAYEPVKAFVLRTSLHDQIHAQLRHNAVHSGTKMLVVWGLGGAGKTQLVLDYMHRHRDEYKATFWIEAGSKESLERDMVRLYQTLFSLHARQETAISVEDAVTGVRSWFAGQQGPWLMVFDGADIIEDKKAEGYIDIKHFIPSTAALEVIITSRSSTAKDMTHLEGVQVGDMEASQAAELFQKYSKIPHDDAGVTAEALAIVKELGCLALAVTLAATYVGSTPRLQSNIKAYLPEYRQRRRDLLRRKPESLVHQYSESTLTTWETSYAAVVSQSPEASVLMTILSFLSFDDIYLGLFYTNIEGNIVDQIEKEDRMSWKSLVCPERTIDVYKIEECFALLQKYSLVQWKTEKKGYAMHQLVHAWGYDRLTTEEQSKYSHAVFELIVEAIKGCGRAPKDKLRLMPHVMGSFTALTRAHNQMNRTTRAHNQMNRSTEDVLDKVEYVGDFITDLGRWVEARVIREHVLQMRSRLLGEEHPRTVIAMADLGRIFLEQGQLGKAVEMQKEALEKARQTLGEEHPDTITVLHNLASMLEKQGQLEEAVEMQKEALEKARQTLGEEHPDTITVLHNLAFMLEEQGQLQEAVDIQKKVLEKARRILGEDHPDTIVVISNLAVMLRSQGHLVESAKVFREMLQAQRRSLGKDHAKTIRTMENLAETLRRMYLQNQEPSQTITDTQAQNALDEAVKLLREVLTKRKRILGEDHADTIRTMKYHAILLRELESPNHEQEQSQATTKMQKQTALVQAPAVADSSSQASIRKRTMLPSSSSSGNKRKR